MTVLNYTDSCWLNPEHVLHFQIFFFIIFFLFHILWDEYIKTFITKYVGQSLRLLGVQLPPDLNHNHLFGLFSCSFQLSILCLLITTLHALNPSRPPFFSFLPFQFLSLILGNINSINLFHLWYTMISSSFSLKLSLDVKATFFTNHLTSKETHRPPHNATVSKLK